MLIALVNAAGHGFVGRRNHSRLRRGCSRWSATGRIRDRFFDRGSYDLDNSAGITSAVFGALRKPNPATGGSHLVVLGRAFFNRDE